MENWPSKKIKKAQYSQKHQYDKGAKESRIEVGHVKLDRNFQGPYQVHGETSTSTRIQPINNPDAEVICASLQCLSHYTDLNLDLIKPWLGHGRARR